MYYESTYEGKKLFVEEQLEPMFQSLDDGWSSVVYVYSRYRESVIMTNANPTKNMTVDVTADSIRALAEDVMRAYLNR